MNYHFEEVTSIKNVVNNMIERGFEFELRYNNEETYCFYSILGNNEYLIPVKNVPELQSFWNEVETFWC